MTNNSFFVETSLLIVLSKVVYCVFSNLLIARLSKILSIVHSIDQIRLSLLDWTN
jgi:hypothetical protein